MVKFGLQKMKSELINESGRSRPLEDVLPIGIYLDFKHWPQLSRDAASSTAELDNLVAVLYEKNQSLAHRPIALMWWRNLFDFLTPADITQLMHQLSRKFHLCADNKREYCIEVPPQFCYAEQLALLRGLGFNHLILPLTSEFQSSDWRPDALNHILALLRKFKFEKIMFSYSMADINTAKVDDILLQLRQWQPNRVLIKGITPPPCTEQCISQEERSRMLIQTDHHCTTDQDVTHEYLAQALQSLGYISMGKAWFVKPNDELLSTSPNNVGISVSPLGYNRVNVRELITLPHFFPG